MQGSLEYIVNDGTTMLEHYFQCGFRSSFGRKVSSTNPPPFDAISLCVAPAAVAGKSTRLTPDVSNRFNYNFVTFSMCIIAAGLFVKAGRPNRSLNRTLCGGPRLAFISFSAKHGPPQSAG